jgi:hypothetical protein
MAERTIFVSGVMAGMIVGIGLKTGVTPDADSMSLQVLQTLCDYSTPSQSFDCNRYLAIGELLSVVLGIMTILIEADKEESITWGLLVYSFGWIIGAGFMFFLIR